VKGQVEGLAEAYAMFGNIDRTAHEQAAELIEIIGAEVLSAQERDVAKRTGSLAAALSMRLQPQDLKARIGLLIGSREAASINGRRRKALAGGPFHGRFVEYGRRAQTVLVTRRIKRRKVRGNGRTSKRRVVYDGKAYSMKVKAMAPRPFVHKDRPEIRAEQRIATFWATMLDMGAA
jgi:hypothetical protein